jgi:hypothetical protein
MQKRKGPDSQAAENQDITTVDPITPKQQQFVELLLRGNTLKQSAKLVDISNRTALYWLHSGPVREEYNLQLAQMRSTLRDRVQNIQDMALDSLEYFLSADAPPELRFRTMKMILESGLQHHFYGRAANPSQAETIVNEAAEQAYRQNTNEILLYDDQGHERIPDY